MTCSSRGRQAEVKANAFRCEGLRTPKDGPAKLGGAAICDRCGAPAPSSSFTFLDKLPGSARKRGRAGGAFRPRGCAQSRAQIRCVQHTCWEKTQPIKRQRKGTNLSAGLRRSPCKGRVVDKPAEPRHRLGFSRTHLASLSMPGGKAGTANPPVRRTRRALAAFVLISVRRKIC